MDARVKAVRENDMIGTGTGSSIDRDWTDGDIVTLADVLGLTSPDIVVERLIGYESLQDAPTRLRRKRGGALVS